MLKVIGIVTMWGNLVLGFWRRQWQPTPVLLPGKSRERRSLVGWRLCCHTESDTLKWLSSSSSSLDNGYVAPSFLYSLISLQIFDNLLQRISARIRYIQSALPLKWKKKIIEMFEIEMSSVAVEILIWREDETSWTLNPFVLGHLHKCYSCVSLPDPPPPLYCISYQDARHSAS